MAAGAVIGSVTSTPVSGTLPVFETWKSKVTTSPADTRPSPFVSAGAACDLSIWIAGSCLTGTVAVAVGVFEPFGVVGIGTGWPGVG